MTPDPFDDLFNLEGQYYDQGYQQGYEDGFQAGKIEGRSVGLKKGFEKFFEAGRLQGKAIVWANRIPRTAPRQQKTEKPSQSEARQDQDEPEKLPPLSNNQRLEKNVTSLYALVEPGTLSTENTDDAVNDFDDRFKRAQGKLKFVERTVREERPRDDASETRPARNEI